MTNDRFEPRDRRERFADPDLTRRILDRTSGGACARAELLLADRWDADLDTGDADLLAAHLQTCDACRELATVMAAIRPRLAQLAERAPDPAFTTRVLAATSGVGGVRPAATPSLDRLARRLARRLDRLGHDLWRRPRLALEVAWTATALTAVLLWSPLVSDPGAAVPATRVVTAGAGAAPAAIAWVEQRFAALEVLADDLLSPSATELATRLNRLGEHAQDQGAGLWRAGRALLDRLQKDPDDATARPASSLATPEE